MEPHANLAENPRAVPPVPPAAPSTPNGIPNYAKMKTVYMINERGTGKSFWTRVGVGFINQDGSITVRLDAVPLSGTLQLRDWEQHREPDKRPDEGAVR